jgi:hypothetical protein
MRSLADDEIIPNMDCANGIVPKLLQNRTSLAAVGQDIYPRFGTVAR